jgi:hypothetical protein
MRLAPPTGNSNDQLAAWARRLTDELNRFLPTLDALPTFADDAAAQAGNLKVGQGYVTPDGIVRRRAS